MPCRTTVYCSGWPATQGLRIVKFALSKCRLNHNASFYPLTLAEVAMRVFRPYGRRRVSFLTPFIPPLCWYCRLHLNATTSGKAGLWSSFTIGLKTKEMPSGAARPQRVTRFTLRVRYPPTVCRTFRTEGYVDLIGKREVKEASTLYCVFPSPLATTSHRKTPEATIIERVYERSAALRRQSYPPPPPSLLLILCRHQVARRGSHSMIFVILTL